MILPLLIAAAAAVPEAPPELARGLPPAQRLVQTLRADLDGDGKEEWIALGEPEKPKDANTFSIAIFAAAKGKPKLVFRQYVETKEGSRVGAAVRKVRPVGNVVVVVAADPDPVGNDSTFALQIFGFHRGAFRKLLPEQPRFASQGGFVFEDAQRDAPGDEILVWTYLAGSGEATWDEHRYALQVFHFENGVWVGQDRRTFSEESFASYEAAAKGFGIHGADVRRQIPRVAEVP